MIIEKRENTKQRRLAVHFVPVERHQVLSMVYTVVWLGGEMLRKESCLFEIDKAIPYTPFCQDVLRVGRISLDLLA